MASDRLSTGARMFAAKRGWAMPDGSYPIRNRSELQDAIHAFGRAKNQAAVKRHIIKRARALKLTSLLPDGWNVSH